MEIRDLILEASRKMEIPCIGIAGIDRWEKALFDPWIPPSFRPGSIYPESKSAIVIGLPVHLPVVDSAPSIWYHEEYKTVNSLLDQYTWQISSFLNSHGYASVSIPRDGYGSIRVLQDKPVVFFSHRHAAVLAGLGTFGRNNMVLTPKWGPRVRFGTILTSVEITPDPLLKESLCTRCNACVKACPVSALSEDDYPDSVTDKEACSNRSAHLNQKYCSPCGICIKVCPVGMDRELYNRPDIRMYEDRHLFEKHHLAWDHIRSYGSIQSESGEQ